MVSTDHRFKKVTEPLNELEQIFVTSFKEQFENAELKLFQIEERPLFLRMTSIYVLDLYIPQSENLV